jgi:SET domain-containing protein
LRREIKRLAQEHLSSQSDALPHDHVNARLQPSKVCEGVGVFAIKSIKKGAFVFPSDNGEMVWISKTKLESANLSDADKQLYNDFTVFKSDQCGCPASFDNLTVAWYLNEPSNGHEPNVKCNIDDGYKFYAARDIHAGEELTARYSEYSLDSWL